MFRLVKNNEGMILSEATRLKTYNGIRNYADSVNWIIKVQLKLYLH